MFDGEGADGEIDGGALLEEEEGFEEGDGVFAAGEGDGWQTHAGAPAVGVHVRGRGPGDSFSLPYFEVEDLPAALAHVESLGGSVIHPGDAWAVCRDSEGSPFGLAAARTGRSGRG